MLWDILKPETQNKIKVYNKKTKTLNNMLLDSWNNAFKMTSVIILDKRWQDYVSAFLVLFLVGKLLAYRRMKVHRATGALQEDDMYLVIRL